jgi:hypothetical protein
MFRQLTTFIRQNYVSFFASAVALSLMAIAALRPESEVRILSSDLAFHMVCEGKSRDSIEGPTELFLKQNKFAALNKGKLIREQTGFERVEIIGLDADKRIINVSALPQPVDRYAIYLRTPPPTKRADSLEEDLVSFAEKGLGCSIRQVARHENGSGESDLYALEVARIEGWFQQANDVQQGRQIK